MEKIVKQPIKKGVARVPVVMQLEALECGAASLAMVLAYYNKWLPLEQIRSDCGVSKDGSNAVNIAKAARHYGLDAKGYRYSMQSLRTKATFPCIVFWNRNHFVVLDGFKGDKAYLNDPARGSYAIPISTFERAYSGVTLILSPSADFMPSGHPKKMTEFAKKRLKGTGPALIFTMLTGIIVAVINIVRPVFSRVFLDQLLSAKNPGWLTPFLLLLIGFSVIQVILTAFQQIYGTRITGKMAAIGNATYMWQILSLPLRFFSQRMAGDIQGRQESNATIANTLIHTFAPLLLNTAMMVFYLVVMLRYSWILTIVGIGSLLINALVSSLVSKKRVNITRVAMRETAKLASSTVSGIEMIETIKSSGAENSYFAKWSGYQAGVNAQNVKNEKLNLYFGIIPQFLTIIANQVVLILGISLAMQGQMTVGMIMAFQSFLTSFMSPAMSLISAGQTLQEMRTQMERIDDVMEYPKEQIFSEERLPEGAEGRKLSGKVEIRDLVFGYSPLSDPVIKGFNLNLEPGKSVAIVGGSGCGKSTMSKLICGMYKPWSGEILLDGKPLSEIDRSTFSGSLAVVDQDIILFEDTIANNIKMWDNSIEDFEMILAARDAQLHDDIMQRPGGYQYKLIDGGKDLSGGQRQRVEIARVLAQDPTIIILDEATSALDAKTEYEVVKAIKDRGISCIVIAHRLSTIRSCDEIILMERGEIRDRGTHRELMESSPLYRELVTSE